MRTLRIILGLAGIFGVFPGPVPAHAVVTHDVNVGNNFYNPAVVHAVAGDTIQWTVTAGAHNVVSYAGDQTFSSSMMNSTSPPYSVDFTGGTVLYRCTPHSSISPSGTCSGMCGAITDRVVAPATPDITQPAAGSNVAINPVTIAGTGDKTTTIKLKEGAADLAATIVSSGGTWSVQVSLSEGSHTITAQAFAADGTASVGTDSVTFAVNTTPADTIKPSVRITTRSPSIFLGGFVELKGTALDNVAVASVGIEFRDLLGSVVATAPADCFGCPGSFVTWIAVTLLPPGVYTAQAIATDTALPSNQSEPSAAIAIVVLP